MKLFMSSRFTAPSHGDEAPVAQVEQPLGDSENQASWEKHNPIQNADISEPAAKGPEVRVSDESNAVSETSSLEVQDGVRRVEAMTMVWTQKELIVAYFFIFLVFFVNSLQQQTTFGLNAYITSSFSAHALMPIANTVSGILGGILKLPTARLINIWGRAEGFLLMTAFATLGLILTAACQNVETWVAAQTFYWVGFNGMAYVLDVFIADTSQLKNRALAFAFTTSPYIGTTFAGPKLAEAFYTRSNFRWHFGTFAIVTPVVASPILYILWKNQQKAYKMGVLPKKQSGRTTMGSIIYYIHEFDAIGILLLSTGLSLFLVSFQIATYQADTWKSPLILSMITIGIATIISFFVWERFFSKMCFIPVEIMKNRTIIASCVLAAVLFFSFYCWDLYFYSYLQVVHNLSISNAGYVSNIYNIVSCFWAIPVGIAIRYYGRFKWIGVSGVPIMMLGVGLMLKFRRPEHHIGLVAMCQVLNAIAGGILVICNEMAAMSSVHHNDIAAVLAVLGLFSSIGGAIGGSVSGAIWTNTLPGQLQIFLPEEAKVNATSIYNSIVVQLSYQIGDPVRTGIIEAYAVAQERMVIAGVASLSLALVCTLCFKDVNLKTFQQVKGRVW